MPEHTASLWRHRDFRTLWIGATISDFGSAITSLALPMTAASTLPRSASICAGVVMPNPAPMGRLVTNRMKSGISSS